MQSAPAPVRSFFVRFLARTDDVRLNAFCMDLLDLELRRARRNVFLFPPLFEPSERYKSDITQAQRALRFARLLRHTGSGNLDLPLHWLTLLGHRLAVELNLPVDGLKALAHVASRRMNLPLKETETWPEDELFRKFTQTALRDEWDYPGLLFRMIGYSPPPPGLV